MTGGQAATLVAETTEQGVGLNDPIQGRCHLPSTHCLYGIEPVLVERLGTEPRDRGAGQRGTAAEGIDPFRIGRGSTGFVPGRHGIAHTRHQVALTGPGDHTGIDQHQHRALVVELRIQRYSLVRINDRNRGAGGVVGRQ